MARFEDLKTDAKDATLPPQVDKAEEGKGAAKETDSKKGLDMMKEAGTIAVLLPGTTFFLNSEVAPAREIMDYGIPIAIGSDFNPGSCTILSMPMIIGLACLILGLTPAEALVSAQ